jgi:hypothetical protein
LGRKKVTLAYNIGQDIKNFIAKIIFFVKKLKECRKARRGLGNASGVYFSRCMGKRRFPSTAGNPNKNPEFLESLKTPPHFSGT